MQTQKVSNIPGPTSKLDAVSKQYVDNIDVTDQMFHTKDGALYWKYHDPRFAEIDQIMSVVGLKSVQTSAYATEYLPQGTIPQTAQFITPTHKFLININSKKYFTIQVDLISMYTLPSPAKMFNLHFPGFFEDLALHLRKEKAISLPKYWLIRFKLWWNK